MGKHRHQLASLFPFVSPNRTPSRTSVPPTYAPCSACPPWAFPLIRNTPNAMLYTSCLFTIYCNHSEEKMTSINAWFEKTRIERKWCLLGSVWRCMGGSGVTHGVGSGEAPQGVSHIAGSAAHEYTFSRRCEWSALRCLLWRPRVAERHPDCLFQVYENCIPLQYTNKLILNKELLHKLIITIGFILVLAYLFIQDFISRCKAETMSLSRQIGLCRGGEQTRRV